MDRKGVIVAVLVFGGLLALCFGFALVLIRSAGGSSPYQGDGPRIGVVEVLGAIKDTKVQLEQLEAFRRDESIRAIVVRIDSPGGAVGPSQELHRAITRARSKKKVVASLGAVAASGGYYAASAADRIVASPGTITGSIGVIAQVAEISELLDLARIHTATFKSGALKDAGSPVRPLTDADRAHLQGIIDDIYAQFVRDVSTSRHLEEAKVRAIADGRVLTGRQALEQRLVDELGNLDDALARAAALAGAKGDPVPVYPPARDLSGLVDLIDLIRGASTALNDISEALRATARFGAAPVSASVEVREPLLR
ncbi:MAG: signal peptide peptidase SppA [Myxococcota bacterium]